MEELICAIIALQMVGNSNVVCSANRHSDENGIVSLQKPAFKC